MELRLARVAGQQDPVPIEMVGMQDTSGESGTPTQLLEKYGLSPEHIVAAAKKVITRK